MSSRTFLQNSTTRHAIFVNRFAGSQIKEILPMLERVKKVTLSRIAQQDLTTMSKKRYTALLADLDDRIKKIYTQMGKKITKDMNKFADFEADFSTRMFTKATKADFTKPDTATIKAAVNKSPIEIGKEKFIVGAALNEFSRQKRKQLVALIKDGIVGGRTGEEISKEVNFFANKIQKNHAAALVRTITNHVSSVARAQTINDNKDVIKGVEWVSTLDGNTTETCQSLDGKTFGANSGPRPPVHWGCRSTVIPLVKDEFSVVDKVKTERPAVGSDGAETVSGKTTYNSWLKDQPAAFQDEVLGTGKGKLFRQGGLSVNKFVDMNFQPLTLKQLKLKEPLAFEKAGLVNDNL